MALIGVLIVILGFALGFNSVLVATIAGIVTGLVGHLPIVRIITIFGDAFAKSRFMSLFMLTLPMIGLLEGLRGSVARGRDAARCEHRPDVLPGILNPRPPRRFLTRFDTR